MNITNDDLYIGDFGAYDLDAVNAQQRASDFVQRGMSDIFAQVSPAVESSIQNIRTAAREAVTGQINRGISAVQRRQAGTGTAGPRARTPATRAGVSGIGGLPPAVLALAAAAALYFLFGHKLKSV
jgi:hypothetical protein